MKLLKIISLTIIIFNLMQPVTGQDVIQPLSPQLENVTVNPNNGFATIRWQPSVSADVGSYVVYTYSNSTAHAVDTIRSPYITEYTHTGSAARYMSITYVVAAMDSSLNISPLSNPLSTIYLAAVNDTCNERINLSWTPYLNSIHPSEKYELWLGEGGQSANLNAVIPLTDTSYAFIDYVPSTEYCFYITAADNNIKLSSSNMKCITSERENAPEWTKTEAVTIEDHAMSIKGSYDATTNIRDFVAERFNTVSQAWVTVGSASGLNGSVTLTIPGADTNNINLYRISAVNNCEKAVVSSSPVRNMVLTFTLAGTRTNLKWNNPYPSSPALFSVWRDTGQGWTETAGHISDTLWSDDYALFTSDISGGLIAYYISAAENNTAASTTLFRSTIILVPTESIFVPNAFTPNDDGLNDLFTPVITFTPLKYELRIYSRTGVLLFQTGSHGEGWDGRHDDKPMPAGAYLWSLRLTTPSGRTEQKSGTVTILP